MRSLITVTLIAVLTSGCATRLAIQVRSDPPGARIIRNGVDLGLSPQNIYYPIYSQDRQRGSVNVAGIKAKWPSGTIRRVASSQVEFSKSGTQKILTIPHPYRGKRREYDESSSHRLKLSFESDPSGATIYLGDKQLGICPFSTTDKVKYEEYSRARISLGTFTARWASGATKEKSFSLKSGTPFEASCTFIRPSGIDGRDLDVKVAIEREKIRIMKNKADAEAFVQMQQLFLQEDALYQQENARRRQENVDALDKLNKQIRDMTPKTGSGTITTPRYNQYKYNWTEY